MVSPQGDNHVQIENEFSIYLSLDNCHNVNHKYSYLYKPIKEQFTNKGIKRTHAYISCVPIEEIKKKRLEFWGKIALYYLEYFWNLPIIS